MQAKFNSIGKICHENRLREFNFKLLHRLTVTKKQLCTYGVNDENRCPYCEEPDSIPHTFVECHYTQTFYVKVVDWFNAKFNCAFSPTSQEKLFGTDLEGEFKWNGSFWWNVFGKKVIPFEVFLFLAFSGIPGNFCTICRQLPVPGYFREDSNAHDGGFK